MSDAVATVTISQHRYEELIDTESRCKVLIDILTVDEHVQMVDIFAILGETEIALDIKKKEDSDYKDWLEKVRSGKSEENCNENH